MIITYWNEISNQSERLNAISSIIVSPDGKSIVFTNDSKERCRVDIDNLMKIEEN